MNTIEQYIEHEKNLKQKLEAEARVTLSNRKTDPTSGGGLTNYYLIGIVNPQRNDKQPPYTAECEDIIEALELNFDEANIFKEIWRTANARKGNAKQGQSDLRSAEKIYHYAGRILKRTIRTKE